MENCQYLCYNNSEIVRVAFSYMETKVALSRGVRLKSLTFLSERHFSRGLNFLNGGQK